MNMVVYQQKHNHPRKVLFACICIALYSIGLVELGRELSHEEAEIFQHRQLRAGRKMLDCGGHPDKLYGHIHMAKTGGTSLNGIFANKFERVCGHKGYSYDAYHDNAIAEEREVLGLGNYPHGRNRVFQGAMELTGFEDCDYVSNEVGSNWWLQKFADGEFHSVQMELHVPCRDPIDHLMSQCNHCNHARPQPKVLACDAETDEEYFKSVEDCFVHVKQRFSSEVEEHFNVKCFDFKLSFGPYVEYMKQFLEERRLEPDHFVQRETNEPRNKTNECIWDKPKLLEKTRAYLLESVPYYNFCDRCIGSKDELPLASYSDVATAQ